MPRKKMTLDTLESAFETFRRHGLEVEVKGVSGQPTPLLAEFIEDEPAPERPRIVEQQEGKVVRLELYAKHSMSCAGKVVKDQDGTSRVVGAVVYTYGPGVVYVDKAIAEHLSHQDIVARRADQRTFDGKYRSFVVVKTEHNGNSANVGLCVSDEPGFDGVGFASQMANAQAKSFHLIGG